MTRALLAEFDLRAAEGKRVLVKPNAGREAAPGAGVTTDPRVVAAVIDAFLETGAHVSVGESPITGVSALDALESTGIAAVARERGCAVLDMDAHPRVDVPVPEGEAIQSLQVCPEVFEHDLVVSVPVMKVHMHTGVTLAVKNMKGALWRRCKVRLHMLPPIEGRKERSLEIAIADMASVLRPHFSVVDGTVGMEGLGPSAGRPKPAGLVVAGVDAFAVDAVCCTLMGVDPMSVGYLRVGAERGYGEMDPDRIDVQPAEWREWVDSFETAPSNPAIEFPNVNILDRQSCSACQSTLLLFLKRYGEELKEYFPDEAPITIAIGKGHEELPEGTLCIGNCTSRHKDRGPFVSGCPPVGSAILQRIRQGRDESPGQDT